MDDDIVTRNPVDWSGDAVLVTSLERVDDAENLGGVAPSRGGVGKDQTDGLLGVDDEHAADSEGNALGVDIGGVLVVDPRFPNAPQKMSAARSLKQLVTKLSITHMS